MAVAGSGRAAVFLDKDGTLIENVPYNVDPALIRLTPRAGEGLRRMQQCGYKLIVISNQSGVGRHYFPEEALQGVEERLRNMLAPLDVSFAGFYWCPHAPEAGCACRKPEPGLILRAADEHDVDPQRSWMIGDILNDVEAGHRAGCRTVLIDNGNETEWDLTPDRTPDLRVGNLDEAALALCSADGRRPTG